MADPARRRPENAPGDVFVDTTCIDCGTCMWMAPEVFHEDAGMSAVHTQPADVARAAQAAIACPTGSIGVPADALPSAVASFPLPVAEGIWHCGFHSRNSFGAASYLVKTDAGNVLVDSPRFAGPLVKRLEEMGGVDWMVLSHRDDVADHAKFAEHFGCQRAIHAGDATAIPEAEIILDGAGGTVAGLEWMHVPGHTKGHVVYRHGSTLFTGDHLSWSLARAQLRASRRACWYSWEAQTDSMRRLASWEFTRILPGHGAPTVWAADRQGPEMARLIEWMVQES